MSADHKTEHAAHSGILYARTLFLSGSLHYISLRTGIEGNVTQAGVVIGQFVNQPGWLYFRILLDILLLKYISLQDQLQHSHLPLYCLTSCAATMFLMLSMIPLREFRSRLPHVYPKPEKKSYAIFEHGLIV